MLSSHLRTEETAHMRAEYQREELVQMIEQVDASMHKTREDFLNVQARTQASVTELRETVASLESSAASSSSSSMVMLRGLEQQMKVIERAASHERTQRQSQDGARETKLLKELETYSAKVYSHVQEMHETMQSV